MTTNEEDRTEVVVGDIASKATFQSKIWGRHLVGQLRHSLGWLISWQSAWVQILAPAPDFTFLLPLEAAGVSQITRFLPLYGKQIELPAPSFTSSQACGEWTSRWKLPLSSSCCLTNTYFQVKYVEHFLWIWGEGKWTTWNNAKWLEHCECPQNRACVTRIFGVLFSTWHVPGAQQGSVMSRCPHVSSFHLQLHHEGRMRHLIVFFF